MSAAKATKGWVSARIYLSEAEWADLRHHTIDENVSASAIVVALLRRYMADPELQTVVLPEARDISSERRRRGD